MKRASLATIVAGVVSLGVPGPAPSIAYGATPAPQAKPAQANPPASTPQTPPAPRPYVAPIKGAATIGMLKPVVKIDAKAKEVVTTLKVTNLSKGAIVRLRCEEFWYDKQGNALQGGDVQTLRQTLNPGDVVTIELRSPWDAKMDRNLYRFSHANGDVTAKTLAKF